MKKGIRNFEIFKLFTKLKIKKFKEKENNEDKKN